MQPRLLTIVSVYDLCSKAFLQPTTVLNDTIAIRIFEKMCQDPQSNFSQYPADFVLKKIGEFNELTGEIFPCTVQDLATASQFAKPLPHASSIKSQDEQKILNHFNVSNS